MNAKEAAVLPIKRRNPIDAVCEITGLSRAALYSRVARGLIKLTKDGRRSFVSGDELERYLKSCEEA